MLMRMVKQLVVLIALGILTGCAIKSPIEHRYNLTHFSSQEPNQQHGNSSILISQPEAISGYDTNEMLYVCKPFQLSAFAHNIWISSPANMLFPLIIQSLQSTNYFYAIASTPYGNKADYRLDTQLITFHQNFLKHPSFIELAVKVVLSKVNDNRVIASSIINQKVPCPQDTPYGGVIAANKAAEDITAAISEFTVRHVQQTKI